LRVQKQKVKLESVNFEEWLVSIEAEQMAQQRFGEEGGVSVAGLRSICVPFITHIAIDYAATVTMSFDLYAIPALDILPLRVRGA
jgi:hypothetical protein